ncbi:hypothetical protein RFI_01223 [Reticulomyxa filosa]|uniref:Uncharacterized protein n=1 Tax=Reticulomyxa filosa TaxID=46433 RepID=X6PCP4_RETFI|nr:hypothetical protein RFI_01223 [Reticulomyxa filosa]|eukprot:ETO35839.1 hypothetical protein RFI_01223 [Reticulomyxa filosa]
MVGIFGVHKYSSQVYNQSWRNLQLDIERQKENLKQAKEQQNHFKRETLDQAFVNVLNKNNSKCPITLVESPSGFGKTHSIVYALHKLQLPCFRFDLASQVCLCFSQRPLAKNKTNNKHNKRKAWQNKWKTR